MAGFFNVLRGIGNSTRIVTTRGNRARRSRFAPAHRGRLGLEQLEQRTLLSIGGVTDDQLLPSWPLESRSAAVQATLRQSAISVFPDQSSPELNKSEKYAAGQSPVSADADSYLPIPVLDPSQTGTASDLGQLTSYDVATREEYVHETTAAGWLSEVARVAGTAGARAGVSSETGAESLFNFTNLSQIADPEAYPWSVNVKLFMNFGGVNYVGSGVLIDSMHVLTAGHCVYEYGGAGWASSIRVVPAYENGVEPFGDANAVQLHSWTGWTGSGDLTYDVGVIDLDRPVGALTGWHGYGYNTDSAFYTGNTFHNPGYPAASPYNGQYMYYWYGPFDSTPTSNESRINKQAYGGQSGSGAYMIDGAGDRFVYAVLSHGTSSYTDFPRLTESMFNSVRDSYIGGDTPSTFDLMPLDVEVSPASLNAGSQFSSMSYVVHNYSSASWSGTVDVGVYLSTNNIISTADRLIQSHSFTYSFAPKSSVVVNVSPSPTVPADVGAGAYWTGVILNAADYSTANNDSSGQDAAPVNFVGSGLNDNFVDRIDLGSVASVTDAGSNVGYTGEPGEPAQSGTINSAWWSWTAPSDGTLTVDTFGSGFDTFLTLATGPAVNALTVLAQNDDSGGLQSLITWSVTAGTQYQIAVDGYSSNTGSITLNLGTGLPNLTPYQPSGWSDKIVVSNRTGTNTDDSPLYTTDTLYVDWAVINDGTAATAAPFYFELYVDSSLSGTWYADFSLDPNWYVSVPDYSIGSLSAGTHTLWIVADSTGAISESNEADNVYERTVFVEEALPGRILGSKRNDLNGDGILDPGEPGLEGWTIYIDQDLDGQFDPAVDVHHDDTDVNGDYALEGVLPGTYLVAEVPQAGWEQTYPTSSALALGQRFDGLPYSGWRPPDPVAAAGPSNLVAMVNSDIGIFDKTGALLDSASLDSFFEPVDHDLGPFDPWTVYDRYSDRYVVMAEEVERFAGGDEAYVLIGVSTSSNPDDLDMAAGDDDWHVYSIPATYDFGGGLAWIDYPKIAADADSLYITGNYFRFSDTAFQGVLISRLDKGPMLGGTLGTRTDIVAPVDVFTLQPAQSIGRSASDPQLFVDNYTHYGTGITVWELDDGNVLTEKANLGGAWNWASGGAPQLGTSDTIDDLSPRLMNAVWRDNSLWTTHTVEVGGEATVRWYEVDTSGGMYSLVQQGDIDPGPGIHTFMPAIAADGSGNMGITYTQSSASQYPSMMVSGRQAGDPLGATAPGAVVKTSYTFYDPSSSTEERWGDYGGLSVDPSDDSTFWAFHEYVVSNTAWGTSWGSFEFGAPQPGPQWVVLDPGETETGVDFGNHPMETLDFGDAPDPTYPTLLANNGARHVIGAPFLGVVPPDAEANGQPTAAADGDDLNPPAGPDDEDGVTFTSALVGGQLATVDVTASAAGLLSAWIDFNSDGDWADVGEQVFTDLPLVAGVNPLSFPVPATPPGVTYARFRLSTVTGLSYDGLAPDGEVEDYALGAVGNISGSKWNDLDGDGNRDAGEQGLGGWTIYVDEDRDGQFDPAVDVHYDDTDVNGDYVIEGVSPGTYWVGEVQQPGWKQTYPGGMPTMNTIVYEGSAPKNPERWTQQLATARQQSETPFAASEFPASPGSEPYRYDDGVSEDSLGLSAGGDMMWGNYFTVQPGRETITSIALTWGSTGGWAPPEGTPCTVLLYDDPDDDGDPSNATLLTTASTTVASGGTDIFTTVPITPTAVSGGFFVSALITHIAGVYPGSMDTTTSAGQSWAVANTTPGAFDIMNLLNNDVPPALIDNIGLPGNFMVRADTESVGPPGFHEVTVNVGQTVTDIDFGNRIAPGDISGSKWNDLNGDGVWDLDEPGLEGWTIFVDANGNETLDAGETSATTSPDGSYILANVAPGTYVVAEVQQPGWSQTYPTAPPTHTVIVVTGQTVANVDFGNFYLLGEISGTKWNDQNADGIWDSGEPGLPGWTIYLDENNNGSLDETTSTLNSTDIPKPIPDLSTVVSLLEVTGIGYPISDVDVTLNISHTYDGDLALFLVSPLGTRVELFTYVGGSGDNFTDTILDDDASTSITTGAAPFSGRYRPERLLSALDGESPNGTWTLEVSDDAGLDTGTLNSWDLTLTFGEPTRQTDSSGNYVFTRLAAGTYTVAEVGQMGWVQTAPVTGVHTVALGVGQAVPGIDFGNHPLPGTISGSKWNDLDGDGVWDTGEPGLEGWTIYVDQDLDGQFDPAVDVHHDDTDIDGNYVMEGVSPGTYTVREVLQAGWQQTYPGSSTFGTPELNFDGQGASGVLPPDTVGDVGVSHYVQATNDDDGTNVTIYNKADGSVAVAQFNLSSLAAGATGGSPYSGHGDPIVLYDHLVDRWLLMEFETTGNELDIFISDTSTPTSNGADWTQYRVNAASFPDYPKITLWPDAYLLGVNEVDNPVYALDRNAMLAGAGGLITAIRMSTTDRPNWPFKHTMPVHFDGSTLPPVGEPGIFLRQVDDELTNPGGADPANDFLELWEFDPDFTTPANSTYVLAQSIPIAEFALVDLSWDDIPQPGTAQRLDALDEVIMWRPQYRNFGAYETLVVNFTVDDAATGVDEAGIRWLELRRSGGAWALYQEGTFAPDAEHRWTGAIAMDGAGNIALAYNVSSSSVYPGIRYAGRLASDPLGTLPRGEYTLMDGAGSQTYANRWGDYNAMAIDPVDDSTFWFTGEYMPAGGSWATRIACFGFNPTGLPGSHTVVLGPGETETGVDFGNHQIETLDFGDAPDPTYPTLLASNGARHVIDGPFLGVVPPDAEADGQPTAAADGDDLNPPAGPDDEDGVTFTSLIPGELASITVVGGGGGGRLDAWIDWNGDGVWQHPAEQIYSGWIGDGANGIPVTVRAGANPGQTFGRFRISSSQTSLTPEGLASDGEVEDHLLTIESLDYGDAPQQYPTLFGNNGARHVIVAVGPWLGDAADTPDSEPDGQPDAAALGDDNDTDPLNPVPNYDDEDGVAIPLLVQGRQATVQFVVSGAPGYVYGYIDWNGDGDWAESGEMAIGGLYGTGTHPVQLTVPMGGVVGPTFARFRVDTQGWSGSPTGLAHDGEVEDYLVEVQERLDFGDAPDSLQTPRYPTLLAHNGARHIYLVGDPYLGAVAPDFEPDGQPNATATGDDLANIDDEDGVSFLTPLVQGRQAIVQFVVSGAPGWVYGYMDWNGDGDWADSGELVVAGVYSPGTHQVQLTVPMGGVVGPTFARFRIDTQGLSGSPTGLAYDGEVEDYRVTIYSQVVDRHIFYNNSKWDAHTGYLNGDPAANEFDDGAIAPDKEALLQPGPGGPSQTATFANYTSYSKGINGIMVDIVGLAATPTPADFRFRVGNNNDSSTWTVAPAPQSIVFRHIGPADAGFDRVTILWAEDNPQTPAREAGSISKQWLEVRLLADANGGHLGLPSDDLFYWGNAIGESGYGNTTQLAMVNATDSLGARNNKHLPPNFASIVDEYDFNRDKLVNATDELIARWNFTSPSTALKKITVPLVGGSGSEMALGQATQEAQSVASSADLAAAWLALADQQPKTQKLQTQLAVDEILLKYYA